MPCAVVSSSHNAAEVLESTGLDRFFEALVDGNVKDELGLRGKPAPDTFLEGAKRLGRRAGQAAVFEDAQAGVAAGRAGKFGRVVGVDRVGPARGAARARRRRRRRRPRRAAVIDHPAFTVEPWAVTEDGLQLDVLAQSESVFALSNGHIGLRGNLDEGEPFGLPGTYLNGFYETRPLPYAEAGYGYPEDGQTVVNATNGKIIRLLVDDEPFDIRYGELLDHRRTLDLRAGKLRRTCTGARRAGARSRSGPSGSSPSSSARWPRSATRCGRSTVARCGSSRSPSSWPTSRAPPRATIRAPPRRCARRWWPRSRRSTSIGSCSCTARSRAGCGWRPGWIT